MKLIVEIASYFPPILNEARKYAIIVITEFINASLLEKLEGFLGDYVAKERLEEESKSELVENNRDMQTRKLKGSLSSTKVNTVQQRNSEQNSKNMERSKSKNKSRPVSRTEIMNETVVESEKHVKLESPLFCGFEVCDGLKRIIVIETSLKGSEYAISFFTNYSQFNPSAELQVIFDPNCFYSSSLYSNLFEEQKEEKSITIKENTAESKKKSSNNANIEELGDENMKGTEVESSNILIRLRLKNSLNEIVVGNKESPVYKINKKKEAIEAAFKLSNIITIKQMKKIMELKLLPTSSMIKELKSQFADNTMIELDKIQIKDFEGKKKRAEEEKKLREKQEKENALNEIRYIEDLRYHLGETFTLFATPIIDTIPFLPEISKMEIEGSTQRINEYSKTFKRIYPHLQHVKLEELKLWAFVPQLHGYIIIIFSPLCEKFPTPNIMSKFFGVVSRTEHVQESKMIFPFKDSETSIRFDPNSEYFVCLLVNSWKQVTSKTLTITSPEKSVNSNLPKDYIQKNKEKIQTRNMRKQSTKELTNSNSIITYHRPEIHSFYIFNKENDQLGGKQIVYTRKIQPLVSKKKDFNRYSCDGEE